MNEVTLQGWSVFLLFGVVSGIMLSVILLFSKTSNKTANWLLASLILVLVWHLLEKMTLLTGFYRVFPHLYGTTHGTWLYFGPVIYFYSLALIGRGFTFTKRHYAHFIPFVVMTIICQDFFWVTAEQKIEMIAFSTSELGLQHYREHPFFFIGKIIVAGQLLHFAAYTFMTVKLLKKYPAKMDNNFSELDKINARWLNFFIHCTGLFFLAVLVSHILYSYTDYYLLVMQYPYIYAIAGLVFAVGYKSLLNPEIFLGGLVLVREPEKYQKSSMNEDLSQKYLSRLMDYMETEKPYLDSELKLSVLAKNLRISPNHLSQIINEKMGVNFFEFINNYRIEEAKRLLADPKEKKSTILKIAYEVGFNNIVTFNKYFRNRVGKSPSQFRKSL